MLSHDARILIVDDMRMVRTAIKHYLTSLGYKNLIEAENGAEAVKRFKDNKIDFIFMDIVMPIMTGLEALKEIRGLDSEVPVAILSSVADQKTRGDCMLLGAIGYILKPISAESGPETLKKVLDKAYFTKTT